LCLLVAVAVWGDFVSHGDANRAHRNSLRWSYWVAVAAAVLQFLAFLLVPSLPGLLACRLPWYDSNRMHRQQNSGRGEDEEESTLYPDPLLSPWRSLKAQIDWLSKVSEELRRSQQSLLAQQDELRSKGVLRHGKVQRWHKRYLMFVKERSDLFDQVVPTDQEFFDKKYCGMFKFRFWMFGEWKDIWIDDRLPTYANQLIFMHSADSDEFWSALLEKAYAKTMGSYRALVGGSSSEAMEDFTGGITEFFDLVNGPSAELFETMHKATKRCSLMGCGINADANQIEASEWDQLSAEEKQRIGLSNADDGEFWMSFDDFAQNFHKVEICHLGQHRGKDALGSHHPPRQLGSQRERRRLPQVPGLSFWLNPQFQVKIVDPDEGDDEDLGSVIIGLMQKNMRKQGAANHFIGYILYQVGESDPPGPKEMNFFKYKASAARSPTFGDTREITGRHKLAPGTYIIVPSTFDPNMEAEFLLRIYSEQPNESDEMDDTVNVPEVEELGTVGGGTDSEKNVEPTEREKLMEAAACKAFSILMGDRPGFVVEDLMEILNMAFTKSGPSGFTGFSKEACRSLLAFVDVDQSGYLQFDEFKALWKCLRLWSVVFKAFDADSSGDFNSFELRAALGCMGYRVPNKIYQSLVMRYAGKSGSIKFDDFVILCVRMRTILETGALLLACMDSPLLHPPQNGLE
uniref:Calpain 9 n=1 Tax=Macrostomum lignano TaxID=282301 RepID=A0A1I8IG28_9PLAT